MRLVAISDLHGHLPTPEEMPAGDVLLIAGDVCAPFARRQDEVLWLRTNFRDWLEAQPYEHIVGIAGNHDWVFSDCERAARKLPWTYLLNEGVEIEGIKIWGSPYSCRFHHWAFMAEEPVLKLIWQEIPTDVNILMVHGPAYGIGDKTELGVHVPTSVGSKTLLARLNDLPALKLFVFGHIHEGYGGYPLPEGGMGVNASLMDATYQALNGPVEIDWEELVWGDLRYACPCGYGATPCPGPEGLPLCA